MRESSQKLAKGSSMANHWIQAQIPGGEWLENPALGYPQADLDTDIASFMNSISPEECDLLFPGEEQGGDRDLSAELRNESWFSDFVSYEGQDSLMPDTGDNGDSFQSEDYVYDGSEQPLDMGLSDESFLHNGSGAWEDPILYDSLYDLKSSMRPVVEAQAAADSSCLSKKEKKMEASIAIYMDRMQQSLVPFNMYPAESNTSSSSPYSSGSVSPGSSGMNSSTMDHAPTPNSPATAAGGKEMVLDLNMNTTSDLPRKHKPRSQAQRDNYIKARKYGACEKHKKQHKRCNCMEVKANRLSELALDSTQAIQPQRPRALQTHILQSKKAHAVQPQLPVAAGSTSPESLPKPVSCSASGIQSTGKSPKPVGIIQPVRDQHGVIKPSSTTVHCTNRRPGVQAGVQAQFVDPNRAVGAGQGIQRTLPGKVHTTTDCVRPRAVVAEQKPGHRPLLWRPSMPVGVFAAMDNTHPAVHATKSKRQATPGSHRLPDTFGSGSLQVACAAYIDQALDVGASLLVSHARETWSRWIHAFSAFASWTGANLGRGAIAGSKSYWSVLQRA